MVGYIQHYRPRVLADELFGFEEITLYHLHMAGWNCEHGQVNTLELPCLIRWSQAKFGYLNLNNLRLNSKTFSSSVAAQPTSACGTFPRQRVLLASSGLESLCYAGFSQATEQCPFPHIVLPGQPPLKLCWFGK